MTLIPSHICHQLVNNCLESLISLIGSCVGHGILIGCLCVIFKSIYQTSQRYSTRHPLWLKYMQEMETLGSFEEAKEILETLEGRRAGENDDDVEDNSRQDEEAVKRKQEFIKSRHGKNYGYSFRSNRQGQMGHIDTWRGKEFPSMIQPISLLSSENESGKDYDEHKLLPQSASSQNFHNGSTLESDLEVYLDYAGSALPTKSLLEAIHHQSMHHHCQILGNPHSTGPAAARTHALVESAKKQVLDFFHANAGPMYMHEHEKDRVHDNGIDAEDFHPGYEIIFTSGTTEGLRIVGENFDWGDDELDGRGAAPTLLYAHNSHTSVLGMREPAMAHGARYRCEHLDSIATASCDQFDNWTHCENSECTSSEEDLSGSTSKIEKEDSGFTLIGKEHAQPGTGMCDSSSSTRACSKMNHLLVLPLECNFGGTKIDARTIITTSRKSQKNGQWYTMLDIAKAASTSPINLRNLDPDFACISFYKLFGAPTGIGALFVKRSSMRVLISNHHGSCGDKSTFLDSKRKGATRSNPREFRKRRQYFGGGSVDVVLPRQDIVHTRSLSSSSPLDSLVHGTINFRNIAALTCGMEEIDRLGGMAMITGHVQSLAIETVIRLSQLRHSNGKAAIELYGAWAKIQHQLLIENDNEPTTHNREDILFRDDLPGPTIAFNVLRKDGSFVGYNEVSKLAALAKNPIQFRVGCFCNPGACAEAAGLSEEQVLNNYRKSGHVCGDHIDVINGLPTGAIRISFGKDSIWEDMDCACTFLERTFVDRKGLQNKNSVQDTGIDGVHVMKTDMEARLTQIYIFPIKSCAAMEVSRWRICQSTGKLSFDREFALVNSSGTALRLNQYPKMGFIQPFVDVERSVMVVSAPGQPKITIDLSLGSFPSSMSRQIRVCGDKCGGTLWGSHTVSRWFSEYLGVQCWLARSFNGTYSHPKDFFEQPAPVPSMNRTSFANEAPLLLLSQTSVNYLNIALKKQGFPLVNTRHFRPNLVVATKDNAKYSNPEDQWESIQIPRYSKILSVVGQCARCSMVDLDPDSGMKGKTLRALAEYRRRQGKITFGIFLRIVPENNNNTEHKGDIWVEAGDILKIL